MKRGYAQSLPQAASAIKTAQARTTITSRIQGISRPPRLGVRLKCTAQPPQSPPAITFALPQNNYDDLQDPNTAVPKILVLRVVPPDTGQWLEVTGQRMEMYQGAFWISLRRPRIQPAEKR